METGEAGGVPMESVSKNSVKSHLEGSTDDEGKISRASKVN
jgi:hypothetical protein